MDSDKGQGGDSSGMSTFRNCEQGRGREVLQTVDEDWQEDTESLFQESASHLLQEEGTFH